MRKVSIVIGVCVVFALALTVMGQAPRDISAIMKEIGPLATGVAAKTPADAAADAAKLEGLFKEAQAFFAKEKIDDATGWAKAASEKAGKAAKDLKAAGADKAAKNLGINCQECHMQHKAPGTEKGTFILKKE
jgi:hypothetical protein